MTSVVKASLLVAMIGFGIALAPIARAQSTSDHTVAPVAPADSAASKQAQKAQRKAERKAARAKKNAELSQLEKNGYSPVGDQINYPQNLQNAQKRIDTQKQGVRPASAP